MNILFSLLRVIHIVAAVLWIGLGFTMTVFINPASHSEAGYRFMKALYERTKIRIAYPSAAGTTVLCGILLYITRTPGLMSATGNIILGIGAVAGVIAFIHGSAVLAPYSRKISQQLTAALPEGQPASESQIAGLNTFMEEYEKHTRISLILGMIALLGMGLARYL